MEKVILLELCVNFFIYLKFMGKNKDWLSQTARYVFFPQEFCSRDGRTRASLCWFRDWKTTGHERTC